MQAKQTTYENNVPCNCSCQFECEEGVGNSQGTCECDCDRNGGEQPLPSPPEGFPGIKI